MTSDHIIVFEPNHTGHRMQYARWLKDWIDDAGLSFTLATASEALTSAEFHEHFSAGNLPNIKDLGVRDRRTLWRYQIWLLARLRSTLRANPEAVVIVPEGDQIVGLIWLLGRLRHRIGLLVMRVPPAGGSLVSRSKRAVVRIVARTGRVRVLAPAMPPTTTYVWRGLAAVPDPVEMNDDLALMGSILPELAQAQDRRWVGVFGALSARKNVAEVVHAAATASADPSRIGIILAGKVPDGYRTCLNEAIDAAGAVGCRVVLLDRFLTNIELDTAIAAADVTVVAYSNDAPSGIFGKAAAAGTVLVAAGSLTLAEAVAPLGSRAIYCELTHDSLTGAIAAATELSISSPRERMVLAGPTEFARSLVQTLL